jgi:hypothetical protein
VDPRNRNKVAVVGPGVGFAGGLFAPTALASRSRS